MDDNRFHVVPARDLREHEASIRCWCQPRQDPVEPEVWIHNAMDGRAMYESGIRKPS